MNFPILLVLLFPLFQVINCYKIATTPVSKNNTQSRKINGKYAKLNQFSWQARITVKFEHGEIFCSGARISREWILTSATCVQDAIEWDIVLGTIKKTNYSENAFNTTGKEGIVHKEFNSYLNNNLGLIKLAELPVNETNAMRPIPLQARKDSKDNLSGRELTVSGWGFPKAEGDEIDADSLLYGPGLVLPNEECGKVYGENIVVNETLCLKTEVHYGNKCQGENGDPLVIYNRLDPVLVGIASFIFITGCQNPNGFTRTGFYLDWIQEHTNITIIEDDTPTTAMSITTDINVT